MTQTLPPPPRPSALLWSFAAIAAAVILGALLLWRAAVQDLAHDRSLFIAQQRLIVQTRARSVGEWLETQQAVVQAVMDNPSASAYALSVIEGTSAPETRAAHTRYLETMLEALAQRSGFAAPTAAIPANVARPLAPGLLIIGPDQHPLARYGGPLPAPSPALLQAARQTLALDIGPLLAGERTLALAGPLTLPGQDSALALVYGVRLLGRDVQNRLLHPGDPYSSARTALVAGGQILLTQAADRPFPALTLTTLRPVQEQAGYLLLSAAVPQSNWTVVRAIAVDEALAPLHERFKLRLLGLTLAGLLMLSALLLAWRHGVASRARLEAQEAQATAAREKSLRQFLQSIADAQPTLVAVADGEGRLSFANSQARAVLGLGDAGLGTPLTALFGTAALPLATLMRDRTSHPKALLPLIGPGGDVRQFELGLVPLASGETLVVGHDLTDLLQARSREKASLDALVRTLTGLIDARDPGSARHSHKVSQLARLLAESTGLPVADQSSVAQAGLLMNVGKIFVPAQLLTKPGTLSTQEHAQVRAALARVRDLLADVPFEGPVLAIINGLNSSESLPDSPHAPLIRLLRLVNIFVSLTSARAFRPPLTPVQALATLAQNPDPADAVLLQALTQLIDNGTGSAVLTLNS